MMYGFVLIISAAVGGQSAQFQYVSKKTFAGYEVCMGRGQQAIRLMAAQAQEFKGVKLNVDLECYERPTVEG